MANTKLFYDLNVTEACFNSSNFPDIANRFIEFGYRTIAIDQVVDIEAIETGKKKKKKGDVKENTGVIPNPLVFNETYEGLNILNRLTVLFSDKNNILKVVQSENLKKYHIFAVVPKSSDAFQFACDSIDADIISYDPADGKNVKLNRKLYNMALTRGLYFELNYFPAIQDSTARKNTIGRGHLYHQYGKSRNIIISSGAINKFSIRGPYDVVNLCLLFGLSEEQSKCAISTACSDLLKRAEGRRMSKALIIVKPIKKIDVINLESDEDDEEDLEMEIESDEEPAQKKTKTINKK